MRSTNRFVAGLAGVCVIAAFASFAPDLHAQASGVIYACANPGNGNLRMVGAQEACRQNERRLTLNVGGGPATTLGSISGQLDGCAQPNINFAGVLVHIPGRAFSVFTGPDGKFQIDNVPPGTYDIAVESGGTLITTVTGVVVAAAPVDLGNVLGIKTSSNPNHCGQCGVSCGSGTCVSGQCQAAPPVCTPGNVASCDTGAPGVCGAGTAICNPDGSGFGACTGQVVPGAEVCGDGLDNDCDGIADDGCQPPPTACVPGDPTSCYTGPLGTRGLGVCAGGISICSSDGSGFGACLGQILPASEICGDGLDNDCDGTADEGCQQAQCATPLDCPGTDSVCGARTCEQGVCGFIFLSSNSVCRAASCTNGVFTGQVMCSGTSTTCPEAPTFICAPYQCGGAGCLQSCAFDGQCVNSHYCSSGSCQTKLPTGSSCTSDNSCVSGNCNLFLRCS